MNRLLTLLADWKGYAAIALLSALVGAGGASYVTALGYRLTISQMQRDRAEANARNDQAALAGFAAQMARIQAAARVLASVQAGLDRHFGVISRDFQNAIQSHPLPSGCVPDAGRMRALSQAVAAANAAVGGQLGSAMPNAE